MILLVDTQALVWFINNDPRLSPAARAAIIDPSNELSVSIVSLWEMAIKVSIGKLTLPAGFDRVIELIEGPYEVSVEPVLPIHTEAVSKLRYHHRDPFDRMIAVQALLSGVKLVSSDVVFDAYGVPRIW